MKYKHSAFVHTHTKKGRSTYTLTLMVSVNGERKDIPLGLCVPQSAYNKDSKSIHAVPGYTTAATDNLHLQQRVAIINRIFQQWELSESVPTLYDIIESYQSATSPNATVLGGSKSSVLTVRNAFDRYLEEAPLTEGWSDGTLRHKRSVGNNLCAVFATKPLNSLNDSTLTQLISHYLPLISAKTLDKLLSDTRCFLRWCYKQGIYQGTSHDTFLPTIKGANDPKEIIFLTPDELHLLEDHLWQPNQQHLERVVDAFLFSCYCGLRHSDVFTLTRAKIHDGNISVRIHKTGAFVAIPLNVHTQRILDKYAAYHDPQDHPFPIISDQKCNDYIKEACRLCGIDTPTTTTSYKNNKLQERTSPKYELISFHCARRTFISIAFMLGIPPDIIIKFTAHSSTRQLKPYLAITEQQKRDNMSRFNDI